MGRTKGKAAKRDDSGVIDPSMTYSLDGAAHALGMSPRWVKDNLISTDAIVYHRRGDFVGIPGRVLVEWVESDLRTHSEWKSRDTKDA